MSDNKTLPEIDNNALAELDKVKIMGRVAVEARIALGVELFIAPPERKKPHRCIRICSPHWKPTTSTLNRI
ncbi:hypothetical protein [Salmonella bongori]|uniref:hypothetical protein n=1 Tax=Salmonella bongori TaxID=54736 RepID=UPI0020A63B1E|nr:hypothetical protein [Salmonella bongori]